MGVKTGSGFPSWDELVWLAYKSCMRGLIGMILLLRFCRSVSCVGGSGILIFGRSILLLLRI